jgi:hydroxyacylglutathione hydrolase
VFEPERLLVTHGDGDHVAGADAIVDRYDVEFFAPEQEELGSDVAPDVRFGDGEQIGAFTAVHVPGHTPHHHAFVHIERSIAVLGDAAFGADLRGLPVGYFVLPPAVYSEDLNQADEALKNLLPYEFETALLYHGSSVLEDAHEKLAAFVNFPGRS